MRIKVLLFLGAAIIFLSQLEAIPLEKQFQNVAVIGCGPAGMFFLHALAQKRQKLLEQEDFESVKALPKVTVFEKSSSPGGIWRAIKRNEDESSEQSTNMYHGMWINAPKEMFEFYDYTFDTHFQKPMPAYLTRKQVLDYIIKRSTSIDENIFENVQFNTEVVDVQYNLRIKDKFELEILNLHSKESYWYETKFDKLVIATGTNSIPKIPEYQAEVLEDEEYAGQVLHSSQISRLKSVKDKNFLLIGDSFSGEDISLLLIKLGASKIFVTSRSPGYGVVPFVTSWPGNKVNVIREMSIFDIVGSDKRNIILVSNDEVDLEYEELSYKYELTDIEAVIFCTGYYYEESFMEDELWRTEEKEEDEGQWSIPRDWKQKDNCLTPDLGNDIPPSENIDISPSSFYNCIFIPNPNIIYMNHARSHFPLLELDVYAWYSISYIIGDLELPSTNEMYQRNSQDIIKKLDIALYRNGIDTNYYNEIYERLPDDHFLYAVANATANELILNCWMEESMHSITELVSTMKESFYEGKIEKYQDSLMRMISAIDRSANLVSKNPPGESWMTFRDVHSEEYKSIYTGTVAAKLKGPWLELEDEEGNIAQVEVS